MYVFMSNAVTVWRLKGWPCMSIALDLMPEVTLPGNSPQEMRCGLPYGVQEMKILFKLRIQCKLLLNHSGWQTQWLNGWLQPWAFIGRGWLLLSMNIIIRYCQSEPIQTKWRAVQ